MTATDLLAMLRQRDAAIHGLQTERDTLRAKVEWLQALVERLAAVDPADSCTAYDDGSHWCHFCYAMAEWPKENEPLIHKDDCLWVAASKGVSVDG